MIDGPRNDVGFASALTTRVWPRALAVYSVFVMGLIVLTWPTFPAMTKIWLSSSAFHHGLLVAPLSFWLIAKRQRALAAAESPKTFPLAILAVTLAAMAWLIGRAAGVQLIEQFAFISLLIAGFAGIYGQRIAVKNTFALGFLFFMAPFGAVLLPVLQQWTAEFVVFSLNLIGTSADLNGVMITTSAGRFEVAEACAGLRFLIASVMIAALISYLAFNNPRKQILFIGLAVAVAIAANWIRAFVIVYLATATNKRIGVGPEHLIIGWVFYGALFLALAGIGLRFADPPSIPKSAVPAAVEKSLSRVFLFLAPAFAVLASASVYAHTVVNRNPADQAAGSIPVSLPLWNAPNWRIASPSIAWRPDFTHADRVAHATYLSERKQIQVTISYFTHDRPGAEIAGYDSSIRPGGEWRRIGQSEARFAFDGAVFDLPISILEGPRGAHTVNVQLFWLGEKLYAAPWRLKADQAMRKLQGRNQRGGVITVFAPVRTNKADAIDDIRDFLFAAEPLSQWLNRVDTRMAN